VEAPASAYDPVHSWQLRASRLLRRNSFQTTRLDGLDDAARAQFFDKGVKHIANVAERIEAQTGLTLASSRALDFGCGVGRDTLPLAERCEHVYGLDISPAVLREADRNAKRLNLENVEWMQADRLAELSGQYDLVISFFVFQHIPSREGERVLATLLHGLRPGGAGAIHLTLRPNLRRLTPAYLYAVMNSYSLNRVARQLAYAGVIEWHAKLHSRQLPGSDRPAYDEVTIIFRKD
jgi:2-polyprenyl-3-methyl-5-hydroxy-6-metoxy-1,4-benzoquinol methylase